MINNRKTGCESLNKKKEENKKTKTKQRLMVSICTIVKLINSMQNTSQNATYTFSITERTAAN